jgi:hypothetical protein
MFDVAIFELDRGVGGLEGVVDGEAREAYGG